MTTEQIIEDTLGDYVIRAIRRFVFAQGRMLDRWAESDQNVKKELWRELHAAGDEVRDILNNHNACEKLRNL